MDNRYLFPGVFHCRWFAVPILCLLFCVSMTGCQVAQSPFARVANNTGGEFAAAATTLSYLHEGKLFLPYTLSSFEGYRANLDGIDQQLPAQAGRPDAKTLSHLLVLYKPAIQVVDNPCLDTSCTWRVQVHMLNQASQAFLQAGEQ